MSDIENLSPQIIWRLVKETNDLVNDPPESFIVKLNDEDITDIQAYIEGPGNTLSTFLSY
jgi:ubiquitin-conjugating enzyme E2 S